MTSSRDSVPEKCGKVNGGGRNSSCEDWRSFNAPLSRGTPVLVTFHARQSWLSPPSKQARVRGDTLGPFGI